MSPVKVIVIEIKLQNHSLNHVQALKKKGGLYTALVLVLFFLVRRLLDCNSFTLALVL